MLTRGLPVGHGPIDRPVPVLLVAAAVFVGLFAVRVSVGGPSDAMLMLYVLPIALLAVRFGRWVGLASAALGLTLFAVWGVFLYAGELGLLAYVTRGVTFVVVGFGIGWYAEQLRAALNAAYASEDRYRALLECAPEAIIVFDVEDGSFWRVNQRAVVLFGLPRDQLERLGLTALSPPRQPDGRPFDEAVLEKITQAVQGRQPVFEWTYRTDDGHDLPCEVRLVRLPDTERVLVRGSITDVSGRLQPAVRARTQAIPARGARAGMG